MHACYTFLCMHVHAYTLAHVCVYRHRVKRTHVQPLVPAPSTHTHSLRRAVQEHDTQSTIPPRISLWEVAMLRHQAVSLQRRPAFASQRRIVAAVIHFVCGVPRTRTYMLFTGSLGQSSKQSQQEQYDPHFADEKTKAQGGLKTMHRFEQSWGGTPVFPAPCHGATWWDPLSRRGPVRRARCPRAGGEQPEHDRDVLFPLPQASSPLHSSSGPASTPPACSGARSAGSKAPASCTTTWPTDTCTSPLPSC